MNTRILFLVGSASLFCLGSAQVTKTPAGYKFRMAFTKGQKLDYDVTMKTAGMPNRSGATQASLREMTMLMPMKLNVTDVNNGIGTVKFTVGPMTLDGRPTGRGSTMEVKIAPNGKPVGGSPVQTVNPVLPDKPMPIGGTWTSIVPAASPAVAGGKLTATYKLLGFKQHKGQQAANIGITMKGMPGGGNVLLSVKDGSLLRSDITLKMTASAGKNAAPANPITMVMTVARR